MEYPKWLEDRPQLEKDLVMAHFYAHKALSSVYTVNGTIRSWWFRTRLMKAQDALMKLQNVEIKGNRLPKKNVDMSSGEDIHLSHLRQMGIEKGFKWWPVSKRGLNDIPTGNDIIEVKRSKKGIDVDAD